MARLMKDSGIEWLGDIPADWKINNVFQLFTQVKNKNSDLQEQNLLSLSYGKIKRKNIDTTDGLLPESFDGYNIIEANDIVLRLTDLQNDQKSLRVGLATERGIVTSAYLTIRNRSESLAKYLYYYLHSFDIAKGFYGMGAGVRQNLNWKEMKWLKILNPPLDEQRRIANFLDDECARIDSVVEKTRTSIAEYKKLKQAIITRAVTKGIRPNRTLKQSGIDWLGDIPADWKVSKLKYISRFMQTKYSKQDGQLNYIGLENIVGWNGAFVETDSAYDRDQSLICEAGDILFGKLRPYLAKIYLNTNKQCCSSEFAVIRADDSMSRQYLWYQLMSHGFIFTVDRSTYGTKMPRANAEFIKNIKIVVPPIEEQREIAEYLDEKTAAIDSLVAKKNRLVTELERLKKSLIFEYVTGKKELST